jgi:hypothetical protein
LGKAIKLVSKPLYESTVYALTLHLIPRRTGERERGSELYFLPFSPSPVDLVRVGVTNNCERTHDVIIHVWKVK